MAQSHLLLRSAKRSEGSVEFFSWMLLSDHNVDMSGFDNSSQTEFFGVLTQSQCN